MKLVPIQKRELEASPNLLMFFCPACGCCHQIDTTRWKVTGDTGKETIRPSILVYPHKSRDKFGSVVNTPRCHLFITNGVIEYLSDCNHAMANQKVELLDEEDW